MGDRLGKSYLFNSSIPYLVVLIVFIGLGRYANYIDNLYPETLLELRGQPLAITIPILGFLVAVVVWIFTLKTVSSTRATRIFLTSLGLAWIGQMLIVWVHGNSTFHSMWLYIPILAMIVIKPPNSSQIGVLILILMWILAAVIVTTFMLELLHVLPEYPIPANIREFESGRYWIPLDGWFGLEGRWPGPYGYNSKTGFVGVALIVYSITTWQVSRLFLLVVGIFAILATDSRTAYITLIVGIAIFFLFSTSKYFGKFTRKIRLISALPVAFFGTILIFWTSPNLTGRLGAGGIWSSYLELFWNAPLFGVSREIINNGPDLVRQYTGAHNAYLEYLVTGGLIGLALVLIPIAIGIRYSFSAAFRGVTWPLAAITIYLVMNVTEVLDTHWLTHSVFTILITLSVLSITQEMVEQRKRK